MAGQIPRSRATTTVASAPRRRTKGSKARPVDGSARRASPTGVRGDRAKATMTAPAAPTTRYHQIPRHAEHHEVAPWEAQRHQGGVRLALDDALATERLADDGQSDQCGEGGEHPPSHGLWVDRCRDRRSSSGLVGDIDEVKRTRGRSEPGEAGSPVTKPHEVNGGARNSLVDGAGERRRCEEIVFGRCPGGELHFSRSESHDMQGNHRPGRSHVGSATQFLPLCGCIERHMEHRTDVHSEVLLEGEGRQHVIR